MTEIETLLGVWRAELLAEIEAAEIEAADMRAALAEADMADRVAQKHWRDLMARVGDGPFCGFLRQRLDAEEPATAGAVARAKGLLETAQFRLGSVREAITELDRMLAPEELGDDTVIPFLAGRVA